MVKVTEGIPLLPDGQVDIEQWLQSIVAKGYVQDQDLLRSACQLCQIAGQDHAIETGESCLQHGLAIANVLADLEVDPETYTVKANGELLACEPLTEVPLAQGYFLF